MPDLNPLEKTAISFLQENGHPGLTEDNLIEIHTFKEVKFGSLEETVRIELHWKNNYNSVQALYEEIPIGVLRDHYRVLKGKTPVTFTEKPTSPLDLPLGWDQDRSRLVKMFGDPFAFPRRPPLRNLRITDGKIVCRCVSQLANPDRLCDHIIYAFLTGLDNELLLISQMNSDANQQIQLPIGLGSLWIPAEIGVAVDSDTNELTDFLLVSAGLEQKICTALGIPDNGFFILKKNEGVLAYIRYLEDLIRETEAYKVLMAEKGRGISTLLGVAGGCGRSHNQVATASIIAGMRASNKMRENWIIANVASLIGSPEPVCLGCRKIALGVHDVPDF